MSISESPYAYLGQAENDAMMRYHEDSQGRHQSSANPTSADPAALRKN